MKTRTACIAALALLFSCNNAPISGKDLSTLGFYSSPETIMAALKAGPKGYHEHFMLGLAYKKEKKYKESILHFANSCFKTHRNLKLRLFPQPVYHFLKGFHLKSDYYDDAAYEIAGLFSLYNEHSYAAKFIGLISSRHRALCRDGQFLKSKSLAAIGNDADALSVLEKIRADFIDQDSQIMAYLRIGSLLEKKSDYSGALDNFFKVLAADTRGWQATTASRDVSQIIEKKPRKLSFEESLLFAKALDYAEQYNKCISVLHTLKPEKPVNHEIDRLLVMALTHDAPDGAVELLISQYSGDAVLHADLLKAHADELWAMNRKNMALPVYQQIIKTGSEPQAHVSLKRVALFMEERKLPGYEQYLLAYKSKYTDDHAGHFLWLLARNTIRVHNTDRALQYLEESVSTYPAGSHSDECRFWLHKIYSKGGNRQAAEKTARDMIIINPDSPYTWLLIKQLSERYSMPDLANEYRKAADEKNNDAAVFYHALLFIKEKSIRKRTARLADLYLPAGGRYRDLENRIRRMKTSSRYGGVLKNVEKYFIVGHTAGINREMKLVPKTEESLKDKYIALTHYSKKYNYAFLEVFSCLKLLKLSGLKENIILMPEEFTIMLFPKPFGACVPRSAADYSLDENILYALMKAESLFKHNAISSAGATGLMQLMPGTAKGIARAVRLNQYDLTDPCTSIRLGAHYIAGLIREFKGNFQYMDAAYNPGAGNVTKWKERLPNDDMDYFTEFTPFIETRYYILRTGKFFTQYDLIHHETHDPQ